jgi:hypothetical protein
VSQSPELSGGTGFTFEDRVAALYLAAVLHEGFAPGTETRTVCRVSLQQRGFDAPLDDVIVEAKGLTGDIARLSLQVKRSLTISSAESNVDFHAVVRDCWATFKQSSFRHGADRYGVAVGEIAAQRSRDLVALCELARSSDTSANFGQRFAANGSASQSVAEIKGAVEALIERASGTTCTTQELHEFLSHFVLLTFDFLHEGQVDLAPTLNALRSTVVSGEPAEAALLWDRLCALTRVGAGSATSFDRARLVQRLSADFRLSALPTLRADVKTIAELAQAWLADIDDTLSGVRLERLEVRRQFDAALASHRWVLLSGLPGSGKSALLRQLASDDLARFPVLVLKSDRLLGTGWATFASGHGLSNAPLASLLTELSALGARTLYIDGVDRVELAQQPIVLDVVRTILGDATFADWRIVVSLRDSGIEPLRNWLRVSLASVTIGAVEVGALNDEEAEILCVAVPTMRPLLFGQSPAREIVRRPFFTKIAMQGLSTEPSDSGFVPHSEVELIEHWWRRGGYNATSQAAIHRQRALVNLAKCQIAHPQEPVLLRELALPTIDQLDAFIADGLLVHHRRGHSVRFGHDIFFEWALLHVLFETDDWPNELAVLGEPPLLGRVVELLSQCALPKSGEWEFGLQRLRDSSLRSQWIRSWLIGPIATAAFDEHADRYWACLLADDSRFLRRLLVWFQAERTIPNPTVLAAFAERADRLRLADLHGWPSDWDLWRRLIHFLLDRIADIPVRLYPDVVAVFGVWQNAFQQHRNRTSNALLDLVAEWLHELMPADVPDWRRASESRWTVLGRGTADFVASLRCLIYLASSTRPDLTEALLSRICASEPLRREVIGEMVEFSFTLAQTHAASLVDVMLAHWRDELPVDQERRIREDDARRMKSMLRARQLAPDKRSASEQHLLDAPVFVEGRRSVREFEWNRLSIREEAVSMSPASPLREPFKSLFAFAPNEALRLVRLTANHAITAWRELHDLAEEPTERPLPLVLTFPWGSGQFWGTSREYLWSRGECGPNPVECAFLALEEWALDELRKGTEIDTLIARVVDGHESIAALGVAAAIALESQALTEGILSLVSSQRLLTVDHRRWEHDIANRSPIYVGFEGAEAVPHLNALRHANSRRARQTELRWLVPRFFLHPSFRERITKNVLSFVDTAPVDYESERENVDVLASLREDARAYVELVTEANYHPDSTPRDDGAHAIEFVSPSASAPDRQQRAAEAGAALATANLWAWCHQVLKSGKLSDDYTVASALSAAKSLDRTDLFDDPGDAAALDEFVPAAVAAAAALALRHRDAVSATDLSWARTIRDRALSAADPQSDTWTPQSRVAWHPCHSVAIALASDIRFGTFDARDRNDLLGLVTHLQEDIALSALREAFTLWDVDPHLAWSALYLGLRLCAFDQETTERTPFGAIQTIESIAAAYEDAVRGLEPNADWSDLPLPPPAWSQLLDGARSNLIGDGFGAPYRVDDLNNPTESWARGEIDWYDRFAAKILALVPLDAAFDSAAATRMSRMLKGHLEWTCATLAPPWVRKDRRRKLDSSLYDWTHTLCRALGHAAGYSPFPVVQAECLDTMCAQDDKTCWELLQPFASSYICTWVFDAKTVAPDAALVLKLCLDRLLASPEFARDGYRSGDLHNHHQRALSKTLMLVGIDGVASGAMRFANDDWREIGELLPHIDRFIRSAGRLRLVMSDYLTLCERARESYPVGAFVEQVLHVLEQASGPLKDWHGTSLPAQIAELLQYFANAVSPLPPSLAQQMLRILDHLVDMGDRRSAALQLGERFRGVHALSTTAPE